MSKINDGGPVFPSGERFSIDAKGRRDDRMAMPLHDGMSLRDWFAGQALAGILAVTVDQETESGQYAHGPLCSPGLEHDRNLVAKDAFAIADAMLAERAKRS